MILLTLVFQLALSLTMGMSMALKRCAFLCAHRPNLLRETSANRDVLCHFWRTLSLVNVCPVVLTLMLALMRLRVWLHQSVPHMEKLLTIPVINACHFALLILTTITKMVYVLCSAVLDSLTQLLAIVPVLVYAHRDYMAILCQVDVWPSACQDTMHSMILIFV